MSRLGITPVACRHCSQQDTPPNIQPYYVISKNKKGMHVWLHDRCKVEWFKRFWAWLNSEAVA